MSVKRCQNCNYVIVDSSVLCSSCGSTYVEQPAQQPAQQPMQAYSSGRAASFSVGVVLSRSFSTFFKHPFVFMGLALLGQIPGIIMMLILPITIAPGINFVLNLILWLIIQGTIAYGVYEVLRGNSALLGQSLSRGLGRIIPLSLGALSFTIFMVLVVLLSSLLAVILGVIGMGLIGYAIGVLLAILTVTWLFCVWYVFVPSCVVERLGPIKSLNRSAELTKGCRFEIFALYMLFFAIIGGLGTVGFIFVGVLSVLMIWVSPFLLMFFLLFQPVIHIVISAPVMAFAQVMIAVTYYELRSVKEGISVDNLANVFD